MPPNAYDLQPQKTYQDRSSYDGNHTINNNYITINNHYIETPSDQPYLDTMNAGLRKSTLISNNQHHLYNFGPYKLKQMENSARPQHNNIPSGIKYKN